MNSETIICSSCGNTNLQKVGTHSYKCEYCGAITMAHAGESNEQVYQVSDADLDRAIIEIAQKEGLIKAIAHYKIHRKKDLKTSKEYVEKLCESKGVRPKKGGCFIATACYGSYDAPEVLVLRKFRDEKLMKTLAGQAFVEFYYFVSPGVADIIGRNSLLKKIVRKYLINKICSLIKMNQ